ncbi:MAG: radical SAM protein [Clostridiales bacterium]|jgi:radical SAM superfamily enzyme YgiQ (UPF0313 family)|nr:radical SAM protein [Clostridiales bacterium]
MKKNNLKFLLVHPEISRTKYNFMGVIENEPLELEYISAMLKDRGHEVIIFDKQIDNKKMTDKVKEVNPDVVYVCGRTRQENFMKEYCQNAKDFNKNIITIVGGIHVQHCYKRMYEKSIDYILISFDIFKILDIISYEFDGQKTNLDNISGICYKKNNQWIKNDAIPFDIKKLPRPDREYFYQHKDRYMYLELLPCAHVRTSYSCPYSCSFCYRNSLNCGKYVERDIEDVVNEIDSIKCNNIYIIDDDFLFDRNRILKFIELIKKDNIQKKYVCYGRADFIVNNQDIIEGLKEIGFYYILTGLEAIDDKYLSKYNKKISLDVNIESIRILNKIGINIMGMFVLDLDFTYKDFRALYKWIKKHKLKHVAISIFTPELESETYQTYKDRIITDNPEHWDYLHLVAEPSNISVKRFYFYYYTLLIKLFLKGQRENVYDFIDYGDYIKSFIKNIFSIQKGTKKNA